MILSVVTYALESAGDQYYRAQAALSRGELLITSPLGTHQFAWNWCPDLLGWTVTPRTT
jgi:hypothetical protein